MTQETFNYSFITRNVSSTYVTFPSLWCMVSPCRGLPLRVHSRPLSLLVVFMTKAGSKYWCEKLFQWMRYYHGQNWVQLHPRFRWSIQSLITSGVITMSRRAFELVGCDRWALKVSQAILLPVLKADSRREAQWSAMGLLPVLSAIIWRGNRSWLAIDLPYFWPEITTAIVL